MNLVTSLKAPVIVVTQDTDILIFLCYHWPSKCSDLYIRSNDVGLYDISTIDFHDKEEFLFKYDWVWI